MARTGKSTDLQIIGTVDLSHSERRSRIHSLTTARRDPQRLPASRVKAVDRTTTRWRCTSSGLRSTTTSTITSAPSILLSDAFKRRVHGKFNEASKNSPRRSRPRPRSTTGGYPAKLGERLESVLVGVTTTMNDAHGVIRSLASDIEQERHLTL